MRMPKQAQRGSPILRFMDLTWRKIQFQAWRAHIPVPSVRLEAWLARRVPGRGDCGKAGGDFNVGHELQGKPLVRIFLSSIVKLDAHFVETWCLSRPQTQTPAVRAERAAAEALVSAGVQEELLAYSRQKLLEGHGVFERKVTAILVHEACHGLHNPWLDERLAHATAFFHAAQDVARALGLPVPKYQENMRSWPTCGPALDAVGDWMYTIQDPPLDVSWLPPESRGEQVSAAACEARSSAEE